MRKIFYIVISIIIIDSTLLKQNSNGNEINCEIGKIIYTLQAVHMNSAPFHQGEYLDKLTRLSKLEIIGCEQRDGNKETLWYKVKTVKRKIGYVSASWVTDDNKLIGEMKSEEAREKAIIKANEEKKIGEKKSQQAKLRIESELRVKNKMSRLKIKYPTWSLEDIETISKGNVKIGYDMDKCREAWGKPTQVNNYTYSTGTQSQWCYGEYCSSSLYFKYGVLQGIHH